MRSRKNRSITKCWLTQMLPREDTLLIELQRFYL